MNDDKSWQKPLDKFLAESEMSIDNHVLARVLSGNDEQSNNHDIADIERALHIEENIAEASKKWSIYPNPFKDIISLSNTGEGANTVTYRLFNSSGVMFIDKTEVLESGKLEINLKHLSSGLYIFQIETGGKKEIHKVIKI